MTYRNRIAAILLIISVGYFGSLLFFKHIHIIEGVGVITHSHPYSDSSHTHSESEIELLTVLSQINEIDFNLSIDLTPTLILLGENSVEREYVLHLTRAHKYFSLRAPPTGDF